MQITWDNPEQLEEYIGKLQSAADRLTTENRRLRKCHGILTEKVCCMDVDLIRGMAMMNIIIADCATDECGPPAPTAALEEHADGHPAHDGFADSGGV